MAAGSDNFINELSLIISKHIRYKDAIRSSYRGHSCKKVILILYFFLQSLSFKKEDGYEISNYTDKAQTVIVDGEMFSWYGSRLLSI
jgi:hypothetical protein